MKRLISYLVLCFLGNLFAIAAQPDSAASKGSAKAVTKGDYILQASDLIRVQVFQEDDLKLEVRVPQEGTIQLPLIGVVEMAGKTVRQAEDNIRSLYAKDFIKNPQVNLSVLEYAPKRVTVLGAVNNPGMVLFPQEQGLNLIDAIAKAGGFNRLAKKKSVTLKRIRPDGTSETSTVNCEDLMKGDSTEVYPLQPDDVINVPEIII